MFLIRLMSGFCYAMMWAGLALFVWVASYGLLLLMHSIVRHLFP